MTLPVKFNFRKFGRTIMTGNFIRLLRLFHGQLNFEIELMRVCIAETPAFIVCPARYYI